MDQNNVENQGPQAQPVAPETVVASVENTESVAGSSSTPSFDGPIKLLGLAWSMFKNNWKVLVSIVAIPTVLLFLGEVSLMFAKNPVLAIIGTLLSLVGFVLIIVMQPAMINAFRKASSGSGEKISVKSEYKFGFSIFGSIILVIVIQVLLFFGFGIFLFVPMIIVSVYTMAAMYVLTLENKRGYAAFQESYALVRGKWWPVFGRILFIGIISVLLSMIFSFIGQAVSNILGFVKDSSQASIVVSLFGLIPNIFMGVISSAYIYFLYTQLKKSRAEVSERSLVIFKRWMQTFTVIGIPAIPVAMMIVMALLTMMFPW